MSLGSPYRRNIWNRNYDGILCSSGQCLCFNPFGDIFRCHENICFLVRGWVSWTNKIECPSLEWFNNQLWVQGHFVRLTRVSCSLATVTSLNEILCIFKDHRSIIPCLEHLMSSSLISEMFAHMVRHDKLSKCQNFHPPG